MIVNKRFKLVLQTNAREILAVLKENGFNVEEYVNLLSEVEEKTERRKKNERVRAFRRKAYFKEYVQKPENKKKQRESYKAFCERNKEKVKEYQKEYQKKYREKKRLEKELKQSEEKRSANNMQ